MSDIESNSDDSFDVVSYEYSVQPDDEEEEEEAAEEAAEAPDNDPQPLAEPVVQVELPTELLAPSRLEERPPPPVASLQPGAHPSEQSEVSSLASSFVPVGRMGGLAIAGGSGRRDDDSQSTTSWSQVGDRTAAAAPSTTSAGSYSYWSSTAADARSVTASVISGFDFLDVGGYSMRRCHGCSYLNDTEARVCEGCHAALVANPNVEMDAQIAMQLQRREELEARRALVLEEKKRKHRNEQPLLVRAQALADEIHSYVKRILNIKSYRHFDWTPFQITPVNRLSLLAADFIELASRSRSVGPPIGIAVTFTANDPATIANIETNGFGERVSVLCHPNDAFLYWKAYQCAATCRRNVVGGGLSVVMEEDTNDVAGNGSLRRVGVRDPWEAECVGWIVGTTGRSIRTQCRKFPHAENLQQEKENFDLYTIHGDKACLPIVRFETTQRTSDALMRLYRGLKEITFDYFLAETLDEPQLPSPSTQPGEKDAPTIASPRKKSRSDSSVSSNDSTVHSVSSTSRMMCRTCGASMDDNTRVCSSDFCASSSSKHQQDLNSDNASVGGESVSSVLRDMTIHVAASRFALAAEETKSRNGDGDASSGGTRLQDFRYSQVLGQAHQVVGWTKSPEWEEQRVDRRTLVVPAREEGDAVGKVAGVASSPGDSDSKNAATTVASAYEQAMKPNSNESATEEEGLLFESIVTFALDGQGSIDSWTVVWPELGAGATGSDAIDEEEDRKPPAKVASTSDDRQGTTMGDSTANVSSFIDRNTIFLRMLSNILERRDPFAHKAAQRIVRECTERNLKHEPEYKNVASVIEARLKTVVRKADWELAATCCDRYVLLKQNKLTSED